MSDYNEPSNGDETIEENLGEHQQESVPQPVPENAEKVDTPSPFVKVEDGVFRITGELTPESIVEMNALKNRTTFILENTHGLTSEIIKEIDSDRVLFSVKGGLDYDKKDKYKSEDYKERTYMSPKGLGHVVKYFEKVESEIDPSWSDTQKCMYAYGCLATDINYASNEDEHLDEELIGKGVAIRSLNGILYGKLTCAGFALTFKEMMDRLGIESYYQNQKKTHSYNTVKLDGKYYGVDVTWDNTLNHGHCPIDENGRKYCTFGNFGRDSDFYTRHGHQNYIKEDDFSDNWDNASQKTIKIYDTDEEQFNLSTFTADEIKNHYQGISEKLKLRSQGTFKNFSEQTLQTREEYLPVNIKKQEFNRELTQNYADFLKVFKFLKKSDGLSIDESLSDSIGARIALASDVIGQTDSHWSIRSTFGEEEIVSWTDANRKEMVGILTHEEAENIREEQAQKLNSQLEGEALKFLLSNFDSIESVIDSYEHTEDMDEDRAMTSTNAYSKMNMILKGKDYLIEKGVEPERMQDVCNRIETKIKSFQRPNISDVEKKENGIDFLSSVFGDLTEIRSNIESVEDRHISEEEFQQKLSDTDYLLSVYSKLNLDEYNVTKDEFGSIIQSLITKNNKS